MMSQRKTLLVDDSSQFFESLKKWLKMKGYSSHATYAHSFTEAAFLFEKAEVDVVLLNLKPTHLNHSELLYTLRCFYPHVFIIIFPQKNKHYYLKQLIRIYAAIEKNNII